MDLHQRTFRAIGCTHTVIATDGAAIRAAAGTAEVLLRELDLAASRFRADSEVSRLAQRARLGDVDAVVSVLLGSCLVAALHAAAITDGLVDPTVGGPWWRRDTTRTSTSSGAAGPSLALPAWPLRTRGSPAGRAWGTTRRPASSRCAAAPSSTSSRAPRRMRRISSRRGWPTSCPGGVPRQPRG